MSQLSIIDHRGVIATAPVRGGHARFVQGSCPSFNTDEVRYTDGEMEWCYPEDNQFVDPMGRDLVIRVPYEWRDELLIEGRA